MTSPNFYQISFGQDFFDELALGMIDKFSLIDKDIIVLLPTKYACHSFCKKLEQLKCHFPSIYAINELDKLVKITNIPLQKHQLINKICLTLLELNLPDYQNLYSITELAQYFADLLYKIDLYQINTDQLIQNLDDSLSLHKQQIGEIFRQFIYKWKENNYLTTTSYNNILINEFSKNLNDKSLIIAGFNSDIPAITKLIEAASKSDKASVIFYANRSKTCQIKPWHNSYFSNEFVSTALASKCDNWHALNLSCDNIKYFSFSDPHQEAKDIIDIVKENQDKKIMIVTSDDDLMVKLIFHLKRQEFLANIVRDHPLNACKTAIWLQLCLKLILENYSLISALALFKHPFSSIDSNIIETQLRDKNFFGRQIFDIEAEDLEQLRFSSKPASFKDHLAAHLKFAENIANQDIWQDLDAKELKNFLDKINLQNEMEQEISLKEYLQLFNHFLKDAFYREESTKANISLLKPLDARLHSADLVIIAGLNEGIFPSKASIDPCFSNVLLNKIGFPAHQSIVAQEAYDFESFANAAQVILTRAEKIESTVTTPSRWVFRMLTLSRNLIRENLKLPKNSQIIKKENTPIIPPLEYRPTQLSATGIDKLIFNPYHIYVDMILKLKKLSAINKELSAADFGNFIHKALEISTKLNKPLIESGKIALANLSLNNPSIQTLWWPRFLRIASWFAVHEEKEAKVFLESQGNIKLNNDFTIIARADRIEEISTNLVNIIDYKTGRLPTKKSITNGKSLQLLIEAIIAGKGGFYWQNKVASRINSLEYILFSGGELPAEILQIDLDGNDLLQVTEQYLSDLIEQYQDPTTPYHYSKKKTLGYCEYEHLSRNFV